MALIDETKGNLWDINKKTFVRSIKKWDGYVSQNGLYGILAPARGGLDLLPLQKGVIGKTLIPKVAEGVFNVQVHYTITVLIL